MTQSIEIRSKTEAFITDFIKTHNGFFPLDIYWQSDVEEYHKNFENTLLNGENTLSVKIDGNGESVPICHDVIYHSVICMLETIGYFKDQWPDSLIPNENMLDHKYRLRNNRSVKMSKDILKYLQKNQANIEEETKERITRRINDISNRYFVCDKSYYVSLSTSPVSFIRLGHYGHADSGSCFRQDGECVTHKFNLSLSDRTFVMTISDKPFDFYNMEEKALARLWGYTNKTMDVFNICNIYSYNINNSLAPFLAKQFLSKLIKGEGTVRSTERHQVVSGAYHNDRPRVTFYKGEERPPLQKIDFENIEGAILCHKCREWRDEDTCVRMDNGEITLCESCSEDLVTACFNCGDSHWNSDLESAYEDGEELVCQHCFDNYYVLAVDIDEYISECDSILSKDGDHFSDDYAGNGYVMDHFGYIILKIDSVVAQDGNIIDTRDNGPYYQCSECEEWFENSYGNNTCETCSEKEEEDE